MSNLVAEETCYKVSNLPRGGTAGTFSRFSPVYTLV
jgi:hypothetical protein